MNWKSEFEVAVRVHQKLKKVDIEEIWVYQDPNAAATERELMECEQKLGFKLDSVYRGFLELANGWPRFYRSYDLFSTEELAAGPKLDLAKSILETQETLKEEIGCGIDDLLIVAMNMDAIGLLAIAKPQTCCPGKVFWIDGAMLDEFDTFFDCFRILSDRNRKYHNEFVDQHGLDVPKIM